MTKKHKKMESESDMESIDSDEEVSSFFIYLFSDVNNFIYVVNSELVQYFLSTTCFLFFRYFVKEVLFKILTKLFGIFSV